MAYYTTHNLLPVCFLTVFVALVAANKAVINMERKGEPGLEDLLEDDYLLLANGKNASYHSRKMLGRRSQFDVTMAPPIVRTPHPFHSEVDKPFMREEEFLATDFLDVELLSRDKRQAGSGDEDNSVIAGITLSESASTALQSTAARASSTATEIQTGLESYGLAVDTVTVDTITDDGGNAQYDFTVNFTGSTDRQGVAYALERLWRDGYEFGGFTIIKSPHIRNAANALVSVTASSTLFESSMTEADIKLVKGDDVISRVITVPGNGFPLGTAYVNNIYIGDNGILSFGNPYNPYNLRSMTDETAQNYICVNCNDFDNTYTSGDVWYQAYQAGEVYATGMLERASAEIRQNTQFTSFSASWVFVATWSNIARYRSSGSPSQFSTFQLVLITDGSQSFARFRYDNSDEIPSFRRRAVHGYRQSITSFFELLYSRRGRFTGILNKPVLHTVPGNTNQNGVWLYQIGTVSVTNPRALCINWFLENLPGISTFRARASALGNVCPCQRRVIPFLTEFLQPPPDTNQPLYCAEFKASFLQDTYSCCYDSFGFLSRYPDAGGYLRFNSQNFPTQHLQQDSGPKSWCCAQSNLCSLYRALRPVSRCNPNRGISNFLFVFGDPHFTSLDLKVFTFNGIGEYRLVELNLGSNSQFRLQCRTAQIVNSAGTPVNASYFSAFAAAVTGTGFNEAKIQVGLNPTRTKMEIYVNDLDLTAQFYDEENFSRQYKNNDKVFLTVVKKNVTRIEVAFNEINIMLAVRFVSGTLSQAVIINDRYKGQTVGLLGNFNGNDTDDFRYPNGNVLPATSTDRELFPLGQAWAVPNQAASILHYKPHETQASFVNTSFTPTFFDEISAADRTTATAICGAGNEQCIYDYALTKNADLANAATTSLQEAAQAKTVIDNRAPSITGTTQVDVEVGKQVGLSFTATDQDGDAVTYVVVEGPSTLSVNQNTGVGQFAPANTNSVKIKVAAKDAKNVQSPAIDVQVRICPGCGANGKCDYTTPRTPVTSATNSLFQIASCTCNIGYTGDTCTTNKDGCIGNPCGLGRTCTDASPADEVASGKAFTCSGCLNGYQLASGSTTKCTNIDECTTSNPCPADSTCTDTVGSYICTCNAGFRKNSQGNCVDIDECVEHTYDCTQTCTNTDGSFTCGCYSGYTLDADNKTCSVGSLPNTCASHGCQHLCADDGSGNPVCKCRDGYKLNADGKNCDDIDECTLNLCAQTCANTVGSFTCSCLSGYKLDSDKLNCVRCEFPNYGLTCSSMCECRGRASSCDPVHGCVCNSAWTGTSCQTNVNECTANPNICGDNQKCTDTEGSYTCSCESGYVKNGTVCEDINECTSVTNAAACPANSVCQNLIGSYACNCNAGYNKVGSACVDINECTNGQSACEQSCQNQEGSYNCYCNAGYSLNDDRKTCTKAATSPCDGLTNLQCSHYCVVENDIPLCRCNRGYNLAADNVTCQDVNECESNTLNKCTDKTTCTNTPGSYTCRCPAGQKIQNDGRSCTACDDNHWGEGCANVCGCAPLGSSTCDKIKGCICNSGWTGNTCAEDIDECASATCQANSDCVNLPGSYTCKCRTGYRLTGTGSSAQCVEINECQSSSDNVCDHNCHDTVGSYYCTCRSGFVLQGQGTCTDVDECTKGTHDCQQLCRNTAGDFTCECYDGYQLDTVGRKTCTPVAGAATCSVSNRCDATNGGCRKDNSTDTCFCNRGYTLNANGFTCDDINECSPTKPCSDTCTNTPAGSFTCSCSAGFQLASDKLTCEACTPGTWGTNCVNNCTCDASNSLSCNSVNGSCTCRSGWKGASCGTDIPECTDTPNICGANGVCNERNGSYACTCVAGFVRSNNLCNPCSSTTWGTNCANTCTCNFANTQSCNATNGRCVCKNGWTGTNCNTNIDECSNTITPACTGAHEVCRDTNGSYVCDCTSGYEKAPNNSVCIDTNECLSTTLNTCLFQCNNTQGSFSCSCPAGYLGTVNACTANFNSYVTEVELNQNADATVNQGSGSAAYTKLQQDIGTGIDAAVSGVGGQAVLSSVVQELKIGSVIAGTQIRIDKSQTDNPDGVLAAVLEKLAEVGSINIAGTATPILNVTYNNNSITKEHTVCDVLKIVRTFADDELCETDANGIPTVVKYTPPGTNLPLIIGLSVAIFVILVLLILGIVYVCCCRKRQSSLRTPSDDRDNNAFRSAFVGNLPTKGNFGASRYMLYSPHTLSDAGSVASEDSSGRQPRRNKRTGAYDFGDMPQWTNDRSPGGLSYPDRTYENRGHEPSSNFSWEHLYNRLDPLRNGQFEVPRPAVSSSPGKPFRDSLA